MRENHVTWKEGERKPEYDVNAIVVVFYLPIGKPVVVGE